MFSRKAAIAFLITGLLLAATFEPLTQLESTPGWLAWLIVALAWLLAAFAYGTLTLVKGFRKARFQLDMAFWVIVIALPTCGVLMFVVLWNMIELIADR